MIAVLVTGLLTTGAADAGQAALQLSSNWAGYALTSPDPTSPATFSGVSGTWAQTAVKCRGNDSDSQTSAWIGLGGYNEGSTALEQIGTGVDCSETGPPSYYAWYELVPQPPISFALQIEPGDVIAASISVKNNLVTLIVRNKTRHTLPDKQQTVKSPDLSSAEWIVEAPSECTGDACDMVPLVNFGSVTMSNLSASANGHTGSLTSPFWTATPLQLVPGPSQTFFGGPDEGIVTYTSTAGTCAPTSASGNGTSFEVAWIAVAQPNC